jgi:putative peptide zinc metalloprotease protein
VAAQLFSPLWYRVADLRPRLRRDTRMHAHVYRGQTWYVLEDQASGRSHRFTREAHHFISSFDGQRTIEQLWQLTEDAFGDSAPTQDETIELLSTLHNADLLHSDASPDVEELFTRNRKRKSSRLKQRFASPLAMRFPLFDPDAFLTRTLRYVRPAISRTGLIAWLILVATAAVTAALHWPALTSDLSLQLIEPGNLMLVWLCYPIVKLLHELGHGYAARRWGCEVHEMGLMFLVFVPLPYVDASTSAALPQRERRMLVAAMGIIVELAVAALALFVWVLVEPGTVRTLAYSIMLISGVSTLLFNGNPLLRFDGYFVLADLLEIPNLASRSKEYFGYLVNRYLFGLGDLQSPAMSAGERKWLAGYAVAAFLFRMVILFTIITYVAGRFFVIGMLLATWAAVTQLILPAARQIMYLLSGAALSQHRSRVVAISASLLSAVLLLLFALPAPLTTRTEGVVWAPDDAELRAEADAVVVRLAAMPNAIVDRGDPLIITNDPELAAHVAILDADLREAKARYASLRSVEQVEADNVMEEIHAIDADLARARERLNSLTIRSPTHGRFLLNRPQDLVGRYLRNGELVGFVAELSRATVRVAVTQADIGLIRSSTQRVDVRFADRIGEPVAATIIREVPAASNRLPSAVLGTGGGGQLVVDPTAETATVTLEKVFHVELDVDRTVEQIGGRTYVRFAHGHEPIGLQWYRRLRQLLLRQFDA